jgi:hypothetical protein
MDNSCCDWSCHDTAFFIFVAMRGGCENTYCLNQDLPDFKIFRIKAHCLSCESFNPENPDSDNVFPRSHAPSGNDG